MVKPHITALHTVSSFSPRCSYPVHPFSNLVEHGKSSQSHPFPLGQQQADKDPAVPKPFVKDWASPKQKHGWATVVPGENGCNAVILYSLQSILFSLNPDRREDRRHVTSKEAQTVTSFLSAGFREAPAEAI